MAHRIELFQNGLNLPICDVERVYELCNWGSGDAILRAVKNSYCTAIAYSSGEPVGIARVISDGVAYSLLVDTMVTPEMKRQGIGKKLVEKLISHCRDEKIFMMKLISSEEGKDFYHSLGFAPCSESEPGMTLKL